MTMLNPLAAAQFVVALMLGAPPPPPPPPPPQERAERDRPRYAEDSFKCSEHARRDARPGRISRLDFDAMDRNGDGDLSRKEIRQAERGRPARTPRADAPVPPAAPPAPAPPPTLPYTTGFPHPVPELARDLGADEAALRAANGWGPETTDVPGGTPIQVPDTDATRAAMTGLGQPPAPKPGEALPATPATPTAGPAAPPASPHTAHLLGAMSAQQIEDVLTARGSRMAGQDFGNFILDMEKKYGVPAVQFLAQATMESQIGGDNGYAQPGHNVGNIRPGDYWTGPVVDGGSGKFRVYDSWEAGVEDYFKLLAGPIYAGKTLQDQIFTYAPPSDGNDSWHYLDQVQKLILQWSGLSA